MALYCISSSIAFPKLESPQEPHWIPGAFPTVFQNETGDPHNYIHKEPDILSWGPHIMRSRGWVAQAHMTFAYWWSGAAPNEFRTCCTERVSHKSENICQLGWACQSTRKHLKKQSKFLLPFERIYVEPLGGSIDQQPPDRTTCHSGVNAGMP
jgi:hypothetical protein